MALSPLPRLVTFLLLLYIAADVADPSIPGVFFFESDVLFVDGVVQLKSNTPRDVTATVPLPLTSTAPYDAEGAAAKLRALARPSRPPHVLWRNQRHDDSASFASSSPPDSSPPPPLS